jgi:hypothetical protein
MIDGLETELRERFAPLADPTDDSNWAAVRARSSEHARHRQRPRPKLLLAAALVLGVLLVSPAVGLRGKVVRLFDHAPAAPERIRKGFGLLSGGALTGEARKVAHAAAGQGITATLWLTPTKGGGFCSAWGLDVPNTPPDSAGVGCYDRAMATTYPVGVTTELHGVSEDGTTLKGPVLLEGVVDLRVQSLELRFSDGDSAAIPFVWVPAPIATGFFLYAVPPRHWRKGHLPTTLLARDAEGHEVGHREIRGVSFPGS